MLNPDLIGHTFKGESSVKVSQESISNFAAAVGEKNIEVAPPTFSISITLEQSQKLLQDSGLDWTRVVHGEQKFEIFKPIVAGDEFRCDSTIETYRVVAGNEIVTVRSDLISGDAIAVSTWSTLVVRA
jgi:predicted RNA-binding protein